jgi:hypothetical protein
MRFLRLILVKLSLSNLFIFELGDAAHVVGELEFSYQVPLRVAKICATNQLLISYKITQLQPGYKKV